MSSTQPAADLWLAFVGTIHSFCARPVEAGVDPRFAELDEQGAAALFAAFLVETRGVQ